MVLYCFHPDTYICISTHTYVFLFLASPSYFSCCFFFFFLLRFPLLGAWFLFEHIAGRKERHSHVFVFACRWTFIIRNVPTIWAGFWNDCTFWKRAIVLYHFWPCFGVRFFLLLYYCIYIYIMGILLYVHYSAELSITFGLWGKRRTPYNVIYIFLLLLLLFFFLLLNLYMLRNICVCC